MSIWDRLRRVTFDEHTLGAIDAVAGDEPEHENASAIHRKMNYVGNTAYDYGDPNAHIVDATIDVIQRGPMPGYRGRSVHTYEGEGLGNDTSKLYLHSDGKYYTKPER